MTSTLVTRDRSRLPLTGMCVAPFILAHSAHACYGSWLTTIDWEDITVSVKTANKRLVDDDHLTFLCAPSYLSDITSTKPSECIWFMPILISLLKRSCWVRYSKRWAYRLLDTNPSLLKVPAYGRVDPKSARIWLSNGQAFRSRENPLSATFFSSTSYLTYLVANRLNDLLGFRGSKSGYGLRPFCTGNLRL